MFIQLLRQTFALLAMLALQIIRELVDGCLEREEKGKTLWEAIASRKHSLARPLLLDPLTDINFHKIGKSAFALACKDPGENLEVLKLFLQRKDLKILQPRENRKWAPLTTACEFQRSQVVNFLLGDFRLTPHSRLMARCFLGDQGVFQEIITKADPQILNDAFTYSCLAGNLPQVAALLQDGLRVDLNKADGFLRTPFFVACEHGQAPLVEMLLGCYRVDPNQAKSGQITPLHIACENGHLDVISLLLSSPKVDRNHLNEFGWTPLYLACLRGNVQVVELLLKDEKVDPNKPDKCNWTPLFAACQSLKGGVVEILLRDERVDPNFPGSGQETPIWVVCSLGATEMVEILLSSSKEIQTGTVSAAGFSAGQEARRRGFPALGDLVDQYQQDPNAVRLKLRRKLQRDGEIYAMMVLASDGYLDIVEKREKAGRFFEIGRKLPLLLQMGLCRMVYHSHEDYFSPAEFEASVKRVLRLFSS